MIATLFHSPDTVFPVLAIVVFCTLTAFVAMVLLAWHDCLTFEIDFATLGVGAVAVSGVIVAGSGPAGIASAVAAGLVAGMVTWFAVLWKPGRIGRGDIWLLAFLIYVAGPDHALAVLAVFGLFCVLTAAAYSRARGKRLFRSVFPAALPGMGAAVLALILRLEEAWIWPPVPIAFDWLAVFDGPEPVGHALLAACVTIAIGATIAFILWRKRS